MQHHLVDATVFWAPRGGGVRRYLLAKRSWLASHAALRHSLLVPGPRDASAAGVVEVAALPLPGSGGYRLPSPTSLERRLYALAPDLLEAGDPWQCGQAVARVGERLGVPTVAFCHSDVLRLAAQWLGPAGRLAARRYLRGLYARYDRVLAPSRAVAGRLVEAGVERIELQPLGVDTRIFDPARSAPAQRAAVRAGLGLRADARLLVYAGRLGPEKNVPELVAAVDRLGAPYHLLLIGGRVRGRSSPRVSTVPFEPDPARLAAWLASADAFVHAGRIETFGLAVLEAFACGLPVAAYAAGALPELVDDAVGRLARPRDRAAGLVAAIEALFAADARALGAAARRRALERHGWDGCLRRLAGTYAELLAAPTLLRDESLLLPA